MPNLRGKRPVRSAKQVQPAPGYVDSSTLLFDSEDEGLGSESDHCCEAKGDDEGDDEVRHVAKKLRLKGKFKAQAKVSQPPPDSSCLAYYPKTYAAIQKWNQLLGLPPPQPMSDPSATNESQRQREVDNLEGSKSIKPEPLSVRVLSGFPLIPYIKENQFYDKTKVGFENFPGEIRSKYFPPLPHTLGIAVPSVLPASKLKLLIKEIRSFTMPDLIVQIYTLVFKKRAPIDFMDRSGFPRSAAFLRVNKLVYREARAFVYGENRFCFGYNFAKSGHYFEREWKELGWTHVRRFLTDIGPENTSLIKDLGILFSDASQSNIPYVPMGPRRFTYNKDVLWILDYLSQHGKILKLKLGFCGRRAVRMSTRDGDFLNALKGVKTDKLDIGDPRPELPGPYSYASRFYGKIDALGEELLRAVMVRPLPLKDLDPRLKF